MALFWEISKRSFQRQLSYRAAALAGLGTNFFFGVMRVAVIVALYGARSQVAGLSVEGAITFTGLTQAIIGFLSLFSWVDVINSVYTGAVGTDLLKPMDYYSFWLAQDFGRAMAQLLMRGGPMMLAYMLFFNVTAPASLSQWAALAIALLLGWLVSFSYHFLVNLASFWTPNALGIGRFAFILSWFLSGFFMPLRFFPDWFVQICYLTPFPHMINSIVEIYVGALTGPELLLVLLGQAAWVLILFLACQLALRAGIRRLVILGG